MIPQCCRFLHFDEPEIVVRNLFVKAALTAVWTGSCYCVITSKMDHFKSDQDEEDTFNRLTFSVITFSNVEKSSEWTDFVPSVTAVTGMLGENL